MTRTFSTLFCAGLLVASASPVWASMKLPTNGRSLHGYAMQDSSAKATSLESAALAGQTANRPQADAKVFTLIGVELPQ